MSVLILMVFSIIVISVCGEFSTSYQNLKATIINIHEIEVKVDGEVVYEIDPSETKSTIADTEQYTKWNDAALDSNNQSKATAPIGLKFADDVNSANESQTTTATGATDSTTGGTTAPTNSTATSTTTKSSTTLPRLRTGEPPPTRSAQLGMGLGISLIGMLIIAEILWFKRSYRGALRGDNYLA